MNFPGAVTKACADIIASTWQIIVSDPATCADITTIDQIVPQCRKVSIPAFGGNTTLVDTGLSKSHCSPIVLDANGYNVTNEIILQEGAANWMVAATNPVAAGWTIQGLGLPC